MTDRSLYKTEENIDAIINTLFYDEIEWKVELIIVCSCGTMEYIYIIS